MNHRASEVANKETIETLSVETHSTTGEETPVLRTLTEAMQHIGKLTLWPKYRRNIILAGGYSDIGWTRTVERMEIGGGERGMILNSQFLIPELPFTIYGHSAVALGTDESKGLLIGGEFRMAGNFGEWSDQKTIEFELSTQNWDVNRPMTKHDRFCSSSTILPDGCPAICGGAGMPAHESTEIRGEDGEWNLSEIAMLRLGRWNPGTTVVNGSMFVIGGYTKNGPTNTVEIWDPRDRSGWNDSSVTSMAEKRQTHSVSLVDDSIFVFGGWSVHGDLESCESLDVRSNKWNSISSMPLKRSSNISIVFGEQILIVGGFPCTTQIDSYNLTTNTWTTLQDKLLQSRWDFRAISL
jgi:hypothetical protein